MTKAGFVFLLFLTLSALLSTGVAQKAEKPWTEWTKQDAQKIAPRESFFQAGRHEQRQDHVHGDGEDHKIKGVA